MDLGKALQALKFDNRMKDWNLTQGTVTEAELKSFEDSLEDLSGKTIPIELDSEKTKNKSQENQH